MNKALFRVWDLRDSPLDSVDYCVGYETTQLKWFSEDGPDMEVGATDFSQVDYISKKNRLEAERYLRFLKTGTGITVSEAIRLAHHLNKQSEKDQATSDDMLPSVKAKGFYQKDADIAKKVSEYVLSVVNEALETMLGLVVGGNSE